MKLLPNEEKLISSNGDAVVLTDHRVMMTTSALGQSYSICIFLEDISSIEVKYKSELIFIILSILSVLVGVYMQGQNGDNSIMGGAIFGLVFFVVWLLTRKHIISIASNGKCSMNFTVGSMSNDKVNDFVDRVSRAKQERLIKLYKL